MDSEWSEDKSGHWSSGNGCSGYDNRDSGEIRWSTLTLRTEPAALGCQHQYLALFVGPPSWVFYLHLVLSYWDADVFDEYSSVVSRAIRMRSNRANPVD